MISAFPPVARSQLETFLALLPDAACWAANGNVEPEETTQNMRVRRLGTNRTEKESE
jgi:hypothetical protein